jgi:uncharacterized protein (DUF1800 family)
MSLPPLSKEAWSLRHARHLLNRAGFGVPWERAEALYKMGPEEAVVSLVDYGPATSLPRPEHVLEPQRRSDLIALYRDQHGERPDADTLRHLIGERRRAEREAIEDLKAWWIQRMAESPKPLEEKMALFWHGHFATSAQKTRYSEPIYDLNALFRSHATGNFKELTIAVGQSASMLDYLDNRKSTKEHPNENWARELMELFTLGVGNYSEDDIKASARAFTGWTTRGDGFEYNLPVHDTGEKTFMGHTGQLDGWDIIDIIFDQPAASTFLCTKLYKYFVQEDPDMAVVDAMAKTFRESGFEVRPVLQELFASAAFYRPEVMGSQVKSPAQFVVQLADDLGLERPPYNQLARGTRLLGQDLFYPPNVKGWDGNRAWINANNLLLRYNLPPEVVRATERNAARPAAMQEMTMQSTGMEMQAASMKQKKPAGGPTEEDRKAYRQQQRRELTAALKKLSASERKEKREVLRNGTPGEKRAMLRELGVAPPPWTPKNPVHVFDQLTFSSVGECLTALGDRFLTVPLSQEQKKELIAALGNPDPARALKANQIPRDQREAVLRLITSMAEYQLC